MGSPVSRPLGLLNATNDLGYDGWSRCAGIANDGSTSLDMVLPWCPCSALSTVFAFRSVRSGPVVTSAEPSAFFQPAGVRRSRSKPPNTVSASACMLTSGAGVPAVCPSAAAGAPPDGLPVLFPPAHPPAPAITTAKAAPTATPLEFPSPDTTQQGSSKGPPLTRTQRRANSHTRQRREGRCTRPGTRGAARTGTGRRAAALASVRPVVVVRTPSVSVRTREVRTPDGRRPDSRRGGADRI